MNDLQGMELGGCELLEEMAQGGMGVIYRARQLSLDRIVAMKILAEHLAHNPSFVERFHREARAIAKVNHPNILAVYDVGEKDDRHYMIMELVEGGSVAELLERRGVLEVDVALDLATQAARGLECAALQNIIHRDVKPDNIMLTRQQVVKVSDFGLAKELDSTMTETQAVMGTPAYMSPEQCDGRDLDSRTDIYSLGGTFYRCITGRLPFEADTAMSMMYRHKHVPLTPPHQIVPALPQAVSEVIVKMMAKEREERYQTMSEVIQALGAARGAQPAFDPGRTVPLERPPQPPGDGPAFLKSDTRVMAQQKSPEEVADTRARCRDSSRKLRAEGRLAQAARELRRLLEVAPDDSEAKTELREIEKLVSEKRAANAEIRSMVASAHYEEALEKWNALAEELRDEQLAKQIEHLSATVVPSLKLVGEADAAVRSGELDKASEFYQEALKLDGSSEKAKQGLKSVERTRQRIQFLLKEGYGHRQNRDYAQAVKVWDKILEVEPENPQARRLIIEARLAAAGESSGAEDFDKAAEHAEGILKLDPEHQEAGKLLAEAVAKRDRVAELRQVAEMSRGKGDLAASARAWKEFTSIAPKSRLAREGLNSTRRALSRQRSKRLLAILILLALGAGGWFGYQDWRWLSKAEKSFAAQDYPKACNAAKRVRLPFFKKRAAEIFRKAGVQAELARASEAASAGRWGEAVEAQRNVVKYYGAGPQKPELERELAKYEYEHFCQLAGEAEAKDKWRGAEGAQARYLAAQNAALRADMKARAQQAENDSKFCYHFSEGLRKLKGGDPEGAGVEFRRALDWRPGSERAKKELEKLGEDPF